RTEGKPLHRPVQEDSRACRESETGDRAPEHLRLLALCVEDERLREEHGLGGLAIHGQEGEAGEREEPAAREALPELSLEVGHPPPRLDTRDHPEAHEEKN